MAKKFDKTTRRGYWNSRTAIRIVRARLRDEKWLPADGKEVWESLRLSVLALNTRGLDTYSSAAQQKRFATGKIISISMDEELPERNDGAESYIAFRVHLAAFAALLRGFRRRVESKHGRECWAAVRGTIDDPKELDLFELLRGLSTSTIPDAMDSLEHISRKGVAFRLPGGINRTYRSRDCGIQILVAVARQMLRRLKKIHQTGNTEPVSRRSPTSRNGKPKVVMIPRGSSLEIRVAEKSVALSGQIKKLILEIHARSGVLPHKEGNWIFKSKARSRPGHANESLRAVVKRMRETLIPLGRPPDGSEWVISQPGCAYILNPSITWVLRQDSLDGGRMETAEASIISDLMATQPEEPEGVDEP